MYKFTYKRTAIRKTLYAKGHKMYPEWDRMDVFLADNKGIVSIHKWSECDMFLGEDFMLDQQEQMEEETGQNVKLKK